MKKYLCCFSVSSMLLFSACKKVECVIQNPFDKSSLANYKCTKDCKSEEQLKNSFVCVACISAMQDTTQTCDIVLADSLTRFYTANPSMGSCTQIDALVNCN